MFSAELGFKKRMMRLSQLANLEVRGALIFRNLRFLNRTMCVCSWMGGCAVGRFAGFKAGNPKNAIWYATRGSAIFINTACRFHMGGSGFGARRKSTALSYASASIQKVF